MKIDLNVLFDDFKMTDDEKMEVVSKMTEFVTDYLYDNFEENK